MDSVQFLLLITAVLRLFLLTDSTDDHVQHRKSFSETSQRTFFYKARHSRIVALKPKCGRMKNRMAIFADGTRACCRYRENQNELRGELYSYQLSRVLDTWNVPPATLVRLNYSSDQWRGVASMARAAGWRNGHNIVMTMYVDDLEPEYLPEQLKKKNGSLTREVLSKLPESDRERLLQWSDLIVVDYLTGHSDRLFCNLINLQWTPSMLDKPIHNLARTTGSNSLVLFDNESSFWVGYGIARHNHKYYKLQREFEQRLCVFRESTVQALRSMSHASNPVSVIKNALRTSDSIGFVELGELPGKAWGEFRSRLSDLLLRVEECERTDKN